MTTILKPKKKMRRIVIVVVAAVLILAILAGFLFISGSPGGAAEAEENILSATVQTSSITTTVVGTGNLTNTEALNVKIPSGLTVDEVLVEAGDAVKQGETLATFTEASVQNRIAEVQTEIEALNAEIEAAKEDTESAYITANVSGRVKALYAAVGDSVESVVLEHGALMAVSLDGLMAVSFETSADVSIGDSVTVELSDGTETTGTVEDISADGICVVTLGDDGPALDDSVTIYDEDGEQIGSGSLYIHQPLDITGSYGVVESLHVGENNEISADTTLITLSDTDSLAYQSLMTQREETVALLQELSTLSQTNQITAAFDGTVESVSLTSESSGTSSGTAGTTIDESDLSVSGMSTGDGQGLTVTQLSTVQTEASTVEEVIEIISLADLNLTTPVASEVPQTEIEEANYTGEIQWTPDDARFTAGTDYTAQVTLTAAEGYTFGSVLVMDTSWYPADGTMGEVTLEDGRLRFDVTYTLSAIPAAVDSDSNTQNQNSASTPESSMSANSGVDASSYSGTISSGGSDDTSGLTDSTGTTSGSTGGATETTGADSTVDTASSDTSTNTQTTAFSISENDYMSLTISVDELDILNMEVGQTASVTLDAIEDETYTGTVTKVNTAGTSSGGVTKYSVELSIERTDDMLSGMSASATITIQEEADILVIPVDALQERMGSVFVYTGIDSDGTTPTDEVEVETGLSDGTYVEILSGLSEDDEVYYTVVTSTDSAVIDQGDFSFDGGDFGDFGGGGGNIPDMDSGERPSMDDMPGRD